MTVASVYAGSWHGYGPTASAELSDHVRVSQLPWPSMSEHTNQTHTGYHAGERRGNPALSATGSRPHQVRRQILGELRNRRGAMAMLFLLLAGCHTPGLGTPLTQSLAPADPGELESAEKQNSSDTASLPQRQRATPVSADLSPEPSRGASTSSDSGERVDQSAEPKTDRTATLSSGRFALPRTDAPTGDVGDSGAGLPLGEISFAP